MNVQVNCQVFQFLSIHKESKTYSLNGIAGLISKTNNLVMIIIYSTGLHTFIAGKYNGIGSGQSLPKVRSI